MNSRHILLVGGLAIGLSSPMAMAKDRTNAYFQTNTPMSSQTVILQGSRNTGRTVLIEGNSSSSNLVETTVSAPVVIENSTSPSQTVIEDRIIKQKHFFKIGIWPLFKFTIL